MAADPVSRSTRRVLGAGSAGLLCVLASIALAFWPALHGEFLNEDLTRLSQADGLPLERAVLSLLQRGAPASAFAIHVASLLLHLCATAALYVLARRLTQQTWAALVAAALFGLHPVHAESVARISALHAPLAASFVFVALLVYAETDEDGARTWKRHAASVALFLCGLMADLNAIVFLPMAIAIDLCTQRPEGRRARIMRSAIHGSLLLAWLVVGPTQDGLVRLAAVHPGRTITRVESVGRAAEQLCWPFGSSFVHAFRPDLRWSDPTLLLGLTSVAVLLASSLWLYRSKRNRALFAGLFIPAALLQPLLVDNAAGAFSISADDLYLPAAGLALVAAVAATTKVAVAAALAIAIAFGVTTHARTRTWRSELAFLGAAVAQQPESPMLQWRLGRAQLDDYRAHGDRSALDAAHGSFESALDLLSRAQRGDRSIYATSGDFVQSNLGLGWSILLQTEHDPFGMDDTAHRIFGMVAERYPENAEAHMALGVAALALGRFDEAELALDKALSLRPDFPEALHNLGQLRVRQRNWPGAIDAFERALRSRPDHLDDLVDLARALAESGQNERAIETAERAAVFAANSPLPLVVRGTLDARRGAFDSALSWADRALALAPDDGEALLLRGKILLARGELFGARTAFTRAADRLPQSFEAHYNLAALYLKENERTAAMPHLVQAYTLRPPDVAADELRRSLQEVGIQAPETFWRLASIDAEREQPASAEDWLGRALEIDPEHGPSHMLLGLLRKKRGDVEGAIAAMESACRSMPNSYPAHYTLGTTLVDAGRTKDGLVYLERALEIVTKSEGRNPESAAALEGLRQKIDDIKSKSH